jgi:mRNA interferase RelE/StbE
MAYAVEILRPAQRQLAKLDQQAQRHIIDSIRALADNPRPSGCKKLSGRLAWRIRVGDYRVIYEIHDQQLVIVVVTLGNRKDVYR